MGIYFNKKQNKKWLILKLTLKNLETLNQTSQMNKKQKYMVSSNKEETVITPLTSQACYPDSKLEENGMLGRPKKDSHKTMPKHNMLSSLSQSSESDISD